MGRTIYHPGDILILIVDDNMVNLQVLGKFLSDAGYKTGVARSGVKALAFLEQKIPDLIIMDIMMPEMDGYETVDNIKKVHPDIPVIYLSALKDFQNKVKAFEHGGVDYIEKPFHKDEILARVATQINVFMMRRQLEEQNNRLKKEIKLRETSENLLQATKRKMQSIFNNAEIGIIFIDTQFTIQYANPAVQEILGFTEKDMLNSNINQFIAISDRGKDQRYWDKLVSAQIDYYEIERQFTKSNKDIIDCHTKSIAYRNEEEILEYIIILIEDVTQKNKIQDAFNNYLYFLQVLIETIPTPVYYKNKEGKFIGCNTAFADLVGRRKTDIIGNSCLDIFPKEFNEEQALKETEILRNGNTQTFETKLIDGKKNELYVIYNRAAYMMEDGSIGGIIGTILDITQIKNAEIRLRENEKKLMELNASKDKFFSIIAHDLKNPFNSLIGLSDVILQDFHELDKDQIFNTVKSLNRSSRSAFNLLQNLLEWAISQTSSIDYKPQNFSIQRLVEEALEPHTGVAERKNITIKISSDENPSVFGDVNMLRTVIRNLISNAIKFTNQSGEIRIRIRRDTAFCYVDVEDNGIGIPEKDIPLLFRIDRHYSRRGTSGETGTSLGLILCKEFVEKNKGEIFVKSELNKGTVFTFSIPLSPSDFHLEEENPESFNPMGKVGNIGDLTILYADDDDDSFNLVNLILRRHIHDLLRAKDGAEAVRLAMENPVDMAILDYEMPLKNGLDTMMEIKKSKSIPIILLTSHSEPSMLEDLKSKGFQDFIIKPVNRRDLIEKIIKNRQ